MNKNAIILLSGGLDSATILALASNEGYTCHTLSFNYGQSHLVELARAETISAKWRAKSHKVFNIDLRQFGGSALTDNIEIPKNQPLDKIGSEIPVTYVPARNTIFLAIALAHAETTNAQHIFIGVNALDYSGYPDCRPEYIAAFQQLANLATKTTTQSNIGITIHTPLIHYNKAQIISTGTRLGVEYAATVSCYDATDTGIACGECDACLLRKKGFFDAGIVDPTLYCAS